MGAGVIGRVEFIACLVLCRKWRRFFSAKNKVDDIVLSCGVVRLYADLACNIRPREQVHLPCYLVQFSAILDYLFPHLVRPGAPPFPPLLFLLRELDLLAYQHNIPYSRFLPLPRLVIVSVFQRRCQNPSLLHPHLDILYPPLHTFTPSQPQPPHILQPARQ
jgi:hypothetical protein